MYLRVFFITGAFEFFIIFLRCLGGGCSMGDFSEISVEKLCNWNDS